MMARPGSSGASGGGLGKNKSMLFLQACGLCITSLYIGFYLGYQEGVNQAEANFMMEKELRLQVPSEDPTSTASFLDDKKPSPTNSPTASPTSRPKAAQEERRLEDLFPEKHTKAFVSGMSLVDRKPFANMFDTGVPLQPTEKGNNKVIILHGFKALPKNASKTQVNTHLSVEEATSKCKYLSLILTERNRHDQCIAIMGQYNSYHISKFMRANNTEVLLHKKNKAVEFDMKKPLQLMKRGADHRSFTTETPTQKDTTEYWTTILQPYLGNLTKYMAELKPIVERAAVPLLKKKPKPPNAKMPHDNDVVIIMVCNQGQSELLMNFMCSCRKRNIDTSAIIVFATDEETQKLSQALGLHTYYNAELFAGIPKQHAPRFGDAIYKRAIYSKLFCVHLVSMLGYSYLFQDVDMIWYKHPLEYFRSLPSAKASPEVLQKFTKNDQPPITKEFEIYMQLDGNMGEFYAPYSGNTGFYYVRQTERTQYFMNHFLASGDLIWSTGTHQAPFLSILNEHASMHGLRVKILPMDHFPGGFHFQRKPVFMRWLVGAVPVPESKQFGPWIFHMSWTENKEVKLQFFQQLGEWYARDTCVTPPPEVGQKRPKGSGVKVNYKELEAKQVDLMSHCCAAEPIVKCHYRYVLYSLLFWLLYWMRAPFGH